MDYVLYWASLMDSATALLNSDLEITVRILTRNKLDRKQIAQKHNCLSELYFMLYSRYFN